MNGGRAGRQRFIEWAKASLVPVPAWNLSTDKGHLDRLGEMIGEVPFVALSEGAHGAVEPLEYRNRIFRYLVEEKSFTAIAIESGMVEGRVVHDYVRGGPGELPTVLAQGIGWTFDQLPQNRDLVAWMRDHNLGSEPASRINFYGFDVPGSPGNAEAKRAENTALVELLGYVARVDFPTAAAFHERLDALIPHIHLDCARASGGPRYTLLTTAERDKVTATISDLLTLLERKEAQYTEASSAEDYEWAYRAALGARQVDAWLRRIPPGWRPLGEPLKYSDEEVRFFTEAHDTRNRAQADNLQWIVRREGAAGKVLIYASRFHLSASPFKIASATHQTAGTYLRRRFGDQLITIGNLIGRGQSREGLIAQAGPETIDGVATEFEEPALFLDLRDAPAPVARWLAQEHPLGAGQEGCRLAISEAFDVLFYFDTVTVA